MEHTFPIVCEGGCQEMKGYGKQKNIGFMCISCFNGVSSEKNEQKIESKGQAINWNGKEIMKLPPSQKDFEDDTDEDTDEDGNVYQNDYKETTEETIMLDDQGEEIIEEKQPYKKRRYKPAYPASQFKWKNYQKRY